MTEGPASLQNDLHENKNVSLRDRAIRVGNTIGINGYRLNQAVLKRHFAERGYQVYRTLHFLLCYHPQQPPIVIHRFAPKDIDINIGFYCTEELKQFGLLTDSQQFSDLFGAIMLSLFPQDIEHAQYLFATNTLQKYLCFLKQSSISSPMHTTLETFGTLYRRMLALQAGETFLDAGCSFGFFPLLIAEQMPTLKRIVGVDIRNESFPIVRLIAKQRLLTNVEFLHFNLLTDNVHVLGQFDTIAMIHVLEHFTEQEMYQVLKKFLPITNQRLIIAVPYEQDKPTKIYDHQQLFTADNLKDVGQWCLLQWKDKGTIRVEDCEGGLLIVERKLV